MPSSCYSAGRINAAYMKEHVVPCAIVVAKITLDVLIGFLMTTGLVELVVELG